MSTIASFAEVAALAGDPARAAMLHALLDGRALTSNELAHVAGITPQTASGHLSRLVAAHLLKVEQQGRHRYHRLASQAVAQMMEAVMQVAALRQVDRLPLRTGPRDAALRAARTCYDHIAGRLGVALADALIAQGHVVLEDDAGLVTPAGLAFFERIGIALPPSRGGTIVKSRRVLCRPCLDWSERRPHLSGGVGAALCRHALAQNWVHRQAGARALTITPKGQRIFRETFAMRALAGG